jgi:asparagine synthase (glutamine-hydrolysing)
MYINYILKKSNAQEVINRVREQNLTYLDYNRFAQICGTVRDIEAKSIPGCFIEAGCALGGSTIVIASIRDSSRDFKVYDVFDMIPPPTEDDPVEVHERYRIITSGKSTGIGGDEYYGYVDNIFEIVDKNLKKNLHEEAYKNIFLIKGLLQETLILEEPVAFAHVDVDWYEPVKVALERIFPLLSVGGSIILDDYFDWGGCRKATDEYLAGQSGNYDINNKFGNLKITKTINK